QWMIRATTSLAEAGWGCGAWPRVGTAGRRQRVAHPVDNVPRRRPRAAATAGETAGPKPATAETTQAAPGHVVLIADVQPRRRPQTSHRRPSCRRRATRRADLLLPRSTAAWAAPATSGSPTGSRTARPCAWYGRRR